MAILSATSAAVARNEYETLNNTLSEMESLLTRQEGNEKPVPPDSMPNDHATMEQQAIEQSNSNPLSTVARAGLDVGSGMDMLALVESKLQDLVDKAATIERERIEIEGLRRQLQEAIECAEHRMAEADRGDSMFESSAQLGMLESLRAENDRLTSLLYHTRSEYQTLLDFIENEDIKELTTSVRNEHLERECELNREIDRLKSKIKLLEDDLGSSIGTGSEAELRKQLSSVRNELMEARHEVVDLRLQCNELAARLAKFQDPVTINHDAISWEDRKQALLHLLEQQDQEEAGGSQKVLEMQHVLEETTVQIKLRDKEIEDLRSLLEQQSVTTNGLAVGAAAIANLVDADEIVAEERQRLKEMQLQWEQKQRQGEIEMSLERAKLARERLEIQEKMQQLEVERESIQRETQCSETLSPSPHKGRWWARLGLKDD